MRFQLRQKPNNSLRLTQKVRRVVAGVLSLFVILGFVFYFQFSNIASSQAGSLTGEFRSVSTGAWASLSTWEYNGGSGWVPATVAPDDKASLITIRNGHTVSVAVNVNADQVVVELWGTLSISAGKALSLINGTGDDLIVNGSIILNGTLKANGSTAVVNGTMSLAAGGITNISGGGTCTFNNGGSLINTGGTVPTTTGLLIFNSGSTYKHDVNGGTLPAATWNPGSLCLITGLKSLGVTTNSLTFGDVTFNSALNNAVEIVGDLTCTGNLEINNSGNGALILTNSNTARMITVAGDLKMTAGTFTCVNSTGTGTVNVSGNYIQTGGIMNLKSGAGAAALNAVNFTMSGGNFNERPLNTTSTADVNVSGLFNMTGGTIDMSAVAAAGTLNITGNFNHAGGIITESSTGNGNIIFSKNGTQTHSSGGTLLNNINFIVNPGSILMLGTSVLGKGSIGTFTLSAGGTLGIGHVDGITATSANGNVQVTGARMYNAGATYIYNGTVLQNSGDGLPAIVSNVIVNNLYSVKLTGNVAVSSNLNFIAGKVITSNFEMQITNVAAAAITGYSATSYVIGNLRRNVAGTGSFDFPVGSTSAYELANIDLTGATGFSSIVAKFTNANPLVSANPLTNLESNGAKLTRMLNYGYWTITPNQPMTGGTYNLKLTEKGFSDIVSTGYYYCIVSRPDPTSPWVLSGTDEVFKVTYTYVTGNKSGLISFAPEYAIAYGQGPPILEFADPVLINGVDKEVGAVYQFKAVSFNLDVWVEITDFTGGAGLSEIDNHDPGNGYNAAWQPFMTAAAGNSSVGWKLSFKVADTSIDTTLEKFEFTAIDIDGSGSTKEWVTAYGASRISKSAASLLTITSSGSDFTAVAGGVNFATIDTSNAQAMFQVTYENVSSFNYRTGVTGTSAQTRQASLYFKSFYSLPVTVLPINLSYFNARLNDRKVDLTWATSSEKDNDYFTIERSKNGVDFTEILTKPGAGNSNRMLNYAISDNSPLNGISYYRLRQTDYNGQFSYSQIKCVRNEAVNSDKKLTIQSVIPGFFTDNFIINYSVADPGDLTMQLMSNSGQVVFKANIRAEQGANSYQFYDEHNLKPGIYYVNISINGESVTKKVLKL